MGKYYKNSEDVPEFKERYNPMRQMKERNDEIYKYYMEHDITYKELAKKFNITYGHVCVLINRRGGRKK